MVNIPQSTSQSTHKWLLENTFHTYLGATLSCKFVLFILTKTFIDIFAIPRNISCLRGVGASWRLEHPLVSSHLSDDQLMLIKSEVATLSQIFKVIPSSLLYILVSGGKFQILFEFIILCIHVKYLMISLNTSIENTVSAFQLELMTFCVTLYIYTYSWSV